MDYLLQSGSEAVLVYAKDNLYAVKTLKEFQYIDDEGRDQGMNGLFGMKIKSSLIVRQKSKEVTALLNDETRFKEARESRKSMRARNNQEQRGFDLDNIPYRNNDDELQRAIEESKKTARAEERRRGDAEEVFVFFNFTDLFY